MKIIFFRNKEPLPTFIGADDSDSVVLFIHGLGGSYWTWKKFSIHLKTNWEEDDSFFLEYDEYYNVQHWINRVFIIKILLKIWYIIKGPGISELSKHLKTVIEEVCDNYENIIIVAHSMGGLVARKYIVNRLNNEKNVGKIKSLITYATPHHGSVLASYFEIIIFSIFRFLPLKTLSKLLI